jgi:hypothetical protein
MLPVETNGNGGSSYGDGAYVMHNCHRREFGAEDKLEDVHSNEDLVEDEEDCTLCQCVVHAKVPSFTYCHPALRSWIRRSGPVAWLSLQQWQRTDMQHR